MAKRLNDPLGLLCDAYKGHMEVFYSNDRCETLGVKTRSAMAAKRWAPTPINTSGSRLAKGWIQGYNTWEGFIGGKDALAKGCSDLLEGSVLQKSGKQKIAGFK